MINPPSLFSNFLNIRNSGNLDALETSKESLPILLWWKDSQGKYLGTNKLHLLHLGLKDETGCIGLNDMEFQPLDAKELMQNDRRVIREKKDFLFIEKTAYPFEGCSIYLSYKKPFFINSKKPTGTIGVSLPIKHGFSVPDFFMQWGLQENIREPLLNNKYKHQLTDRQLECLYYVTKGLRSKDIAKQLSLSHRTIEHHLEAIKHKLCCYSRIELIEKAKIIEPIKERLLLDYLSQQAKNI